MEINRHDDAGPTPEERDDAPETSADDLVREVELDEEEAAADPDESSTPDPHSSARIPEDL
ncbi:MAG: hypothetical protein ACR2KD_07820 [Thermoleophilaceae bacterium]